LRAGATFSFLFTWNQPSVWLILQILSHSPNGASNTQRNPVIQPNLPFKCLYERIKLDVDEREEQLEPIREKGELPPELKEEVRTRPNILAVTTLVRLSQGLVVPPPIRLLVT